MNDIVPKLYEKIIDDFNGYILSDSEIKKFNKKLSSGKATQEDATEYSKRVSKAASKALLKNLKSEEMPDGILYWNIANRTVKPLMRLVHNMIVDAASEVVEMEYKKKNIGIKPVKPKFQEERANEFINKLVYISQIASSEVEI